MTTFKHFKTLREARAYMKEVDPHGVRLTYRKKKGTHAKPYAVATPIEHLHFTPDSWLAKKKRKA